MPYTKINSRTRFNKTIKEAVVAIMGGNEGKMVKGEYFGFLVNRLVKLFAQTGDFNLAAANSAQFNINKRTLLSKQADKLASMINSDDPLDSGGDLNYVISSIWWGILGDAPEVDTANYGFRAYLHGQMMQVLDNLKRSTFVQSTPAANLMASRRYTVALGVVGNVCAECYARKDRPYEDQKMQENGDIWVEGNLLQDEE